MRSLVAFLTSHIPLAGFGDRETKGTKWLTFVMHFSTLMEVDKNNLIRNET